MSRHNVTNVVKFKGVFSSLRLDWRTPARLYQELNREFKFDYDPCPVNPKKDGLTTEWGRRNYVNPPYGREIGKWCGKAWLEACKGKLVVLLIPSRTDTKYFHDYVIHADEFRFIKGRLQFDDCGTGAPFPSMIAIWRGKN